MKLEGFQTYDIQKITEIFPNKLSFQTYFTIVDPKVLPPLSQINFRYISKVLAGEKKLFDVKDLAITKSPP